MTLSTLPHTMTRIKHALPESPIAVFLNRSRDTDRHFDTIFANTIGFHKRLMNKREFNKFLGVFDNRCNINEVRNELREAAGV
jgi:hypothetical protein